MVWTYHEGTHLEALGRYLICLLSATGVSGSFSVLKGAEDVVTATVQYSRGLELKEGY